MVTFDEIQALSAPPADHRIGYGPDPLQFGDLRLPEEPGPHPVVVVVHGGCWRAENDLRHIAPVSAALAALGFATWTLEYRRIGNAGGGWSGTFQDVGQGTDFLRSLARQFPLDLNRVALLGHSAGGQLALWLAARRNLPSTSPLFRPGPLPVRGVVSLAGISDLRGYSEGSGYCNASVVPLLGGTPAERPDRYAQASPIELLPFGVPVRMLHGFADAVVPIAQSEAFAARAAAKGDDAQLWKIEGAGHFDLIAPFTPAWQHVAKAVGSVLAL